ncbi:Zn(2)-C6 fungal-type DNA-binding domain [Phaffia rhodozyma]|uniref:Zn(2)-C6 fungal-type DNA-binding domain n=1 Tax=Phaffia rhodozyma TaxID=264483 RepID=A0A0F7SLZ1_PHARH|nr:Zn(2)-C6 fungal-type DNA-binding domain [Phaffia rhodozyma]
MHPSKDPASLSLLNHTLFDVTPSLFFLLTRYHCGTLFDIADSFRSRRSAVDVNINHRSGVFSTASFCLCKPVQPHFTPDNQSENKAIPSSGRTDYTGRQQPNSGPTYIRSKDWSPLIASTAWADQSGSIESALLAQQPSVDSTFLVDQGEALDGISIWGEEFTENRYENPAVGPSRPVHLFHVFTPSSSSSSSSSSAYRFPFRRQSHNTSSFVNSNLIPTPISSTSSSSTSSVNNQLNSSAHDQQAMSAPFVATGPFEETTFNRYQQMFNEKQASERRFNIASSSSAVPSTGAPKDYVTTGPSVDLSIAPSVFSPSSSTPAVHSERRASFHHYPQQQQQQQQQQQNHQRRLSITDVKLWPHQASSALFSHHFPTGPSETSGSDVSRFPYGHNPPASGFSSTLSSSPSTSSLPSSLGLTPKTSSTLSTVQEGCLPVQDISGSWTTESSLVPSSDLNTDSNNHLKSIQSAQSGYWMNNPSLMYAPLPSGSPAHQQTPLGVTHSSSSSSSSSSIPAQSFLGPSSSSSSSPYSANTAPFRSSNDYASHPIGLQITQEQSRLLLLGQQRLQAQQKCFTPEAPESSSSSASASSLTAVGSPFASDHRRSSETHGLPLMTTAALAAATIEPRSFQVGSYPPTTSVGLTNLSMMNASLPTDLPNELSRSSSFEQTGEDSHQAFNWTATSSSGSSSMTYNEKDPTWAVVRATKVELHEIGSGSEKGLTAKRKETNHSTKGGSTSIDRKCSKKKTISRSSATSVAESGNDLKEPEASEQVDGRPDRSLAQGTKKVSLACHFCRGRKLRCDATRPTCAHCVKRGLSCTYDSVIRRRGPGKRKNEEKILGEGLDFEGGETDE